MSKTPQEKLLKLAEAMEDPATFAYKETERLDDKIDTEVTRLDDSIKTISLTPGDKGEKGDTGDKGERGEKGADGKDGRDGINGKDGKDGAKGDKGDPGKDGESIKGEDGKDGSPDTPEEVRDKLESLKKEKRLDVSAIKGIEERFKRSETDWSAAINRVMLVATGSGGGTGTVTGTGVANQVAYWDSSTNLTSSSYFTMDGTFVGIGTLYTPVIKTELVIATGSTSRKGLVIQTAASPITAAMEIQDSTGRPNFKMETAGNNRLTISASGTMASAVYSDFVLSVQSTSSDYSWLEILNNGGANKGAFFGMAFNQFQLFNWQGGDIEFWTGLTTTDGTRYPRVTISVDGNLGLDGANQYGWGHGWGGGKGVLALANAHTAPTTSLTTALGMYSVSGELWYMAPSNQARKVVASTAALTSGKYPKATTGGLLTDGPTPLAGTKVYYVSDTSGGAVTRKLTFTDGILTSET